jgi:hypothetical protein
VPINLGLAGFNGLELLDGLPVRLATLDACRLEIALRAAQIIAARNADPALGPEVVELFPTLQPGDTIRHFWHAAEETLKRVDRSPRNGTPFPGRHKRREFSGCSGSQPERFAPVGRRKILFQPPARLRTH